MGYGTLVGNKNPMTSVRSCEYPHFFGYISSFSHEPPPLICRSIGSEIGPNPNIQLRVKPGFLLRFLRNFFRHPGPGTLFFPAEDTW